MDPAVAALAKLSGAKLPAGDVLQQPVLTAVSVEFKNRLSTPRNAREGARFAATLGAVAGQIKDPAVRRAWLEGLAAAVKGHETFPAGKNTQRDPAADAVQKLLAAAPAQ